MKDYKWCVKGNDQAVNLKQLMAFVHSDSLKPYKFIDVGSGSDMKSCVKQVIVTWLTMD